jgi:hypothetical protein
MVGKLATRRGIKLGVQSLLVRTLYLLNGFLIIGTAHRFGWIGLGRIAGNLSSRQEQHVSVGWRFALFIHLGSRTKLYTGGVECVH